MIYFKKDLKEKLNKIKKGNFYVVSDFDRTLTVPSYQSTSWGVLSVSGILPESYSIDRNNLYNKYHPYEIDYTLDAKEKERLMEEWWREHLGLFVKYKVPRNIFKTIGQSQKYIIYREGLKEFLNVLNKNSVPVVILSAGIGNIIGESLKASFNNISVLSNFVKFKNNITEDFKGGIINSFNKSSAKYSPKLIKALKGREYAFLFGDTLEDAKMVPNNIKAIKIGFCESNKKEDIELYKTVFDVVCTNGTSYTQFLDALRKKFNFDFDKIF